MIPPMDAGNGWRISFMTEGCYTAERQGDDKGYRRHVWVGYFIGDLEQCERFCQEKTGSLAGQVERLTKDLAESQAECNGLRIRMEMAQDERNTLQRTVNAIIKTLVDGGEM